MPSDSLKLSETWIRDSEGLFSLQRLCFSAGICLFIRGEDRWHSTIRQYLAMCSGCFRSEKPSLSRMRDST